MPAAAAVIVERFPTLAKVELVGTAYDTLFKRLCREGLLKTAARFALMDQRQPVGETCRPLGSEDETPLQGRQQPVCPLDLSRPAGSPVLADHLQHLFVDQVLDRLAIDLGAGR